ncbi:hypothetical protein MMPV_000262 [Pyropia vietnamensis]
MAPLRRTIGGVALLVVAAAATAAAPAAADELWDLSPDALADFVLGDMNLTADPCNDAYEFACGGWLAKNTIPPYEKGFGRSYRSVKVRVRKALDAMFRGEMAATKPGILYADCMADRPDDLSMLGRFGPSLHPLVNDGSYKAIVNAVATLHSNYGGSPLVEPDVTNNRMVAGQMTVWMDRPTLGMSSSGFKAKTPEDMELQMAYKKFLRAMMATASEAGLLGNSSTAGLAGSGWSSIDEVADAVYDFEVKLREFRIIGYKAWKALDNPPRYIFMPLASTPDLELPAAMFKLLGVKLPADGQVICKYPKYHAALNDWLKSDVVGNVGSARATLQAYFAMKATRAFASRGLTGPTAAAAFDAYKVVVKGSKAPPPKLNLCVDHVADMFPADVGAAFTAKYFSAEKTRFANEMVSDIRAAYKSIIQRADWMDQPTRGAALKKLDQMGQVVADVTPNAGDDTSAVVVTAGKYAESFLSAALHEWRIQWLRLSRPRASKEVSLRPWKTNARYSSGRNEFTIPAGILQVPFFSPNAPHALTFGAVGRTMGHEITHGFDNRGRRFDGRGVYTQWWSNSTDSAFEKKAQCFVDLFNTYVPPDLPNLHVDGSNTLPENLADAGGIKSSWEAFQARVSARRAGPRNPKLHAKFNDDQLFAIGFAQTWCRKYTVEAQRKRLKEDVHSPGRFRAEGTLSQFPPFAAAFKCKAGARYNPAKRCSLW